MNISQNVLTKIICLIYQESNIRKKEYIDCENFIKRPIFIRILYLNGINIDCFFHLIFKRKIYHGTSNLLWENSFFELANYEIYNLKIKGPKIGLYLTETYGDWNKEKKIIFITKICFFK